MYNVHGCPYDACLDQKVLLVNNLPKTELTFFITGKPLFNTKNSLTAIIITAGKKP